MSPLKLWLSCAVMMIVCSVTRSAATPSGAFPTTESRNVDYDKDEMVIEDITTDANAGSQGTTDSTRENWIDMQETTTLLDEVSHGKLRYEPDRNETIIDDTRADTREISTDTPAETVTDVQTTSTGAQNIPIDQREILTSTQGIPTRTDFNVTTTPAETQEDQKRRARLEIDKQVRVEGIKLWVEQNIKMHNNDVVTAINSTREKIKRKNKTWKKPNADISGADHVAKKPGEQ